MNTPAEIMNARGGHYLDAAWPKSARLGLRGGLTVAALAAVLLPMSSRPQQENPAPGVASSLRLESSPAGNPSPEQLPSRQGLVPSASAGVDALCVAIIDGRWQSALQMIDSGVPVNGVNERNQTPLGCLVDLWRSRTPQDKERRDVLQKLLQHGADPFAPTATVGSSNDRRSPVEKAMKNVDGMLGDILLTNNPSPARRTPSGKNALDLALRPFRSGIVDFLLAHGFSANQTNADGLTPLQEMAGISPNFTFIPARKPPPYFVHHGEYLDYYDAIVADFLLSRGATVDVFSAAGMGLTNQLAALLRSDPRLANARDRFGRTPLHYAASGQSNTTALLLKAAADPAARTTRPIDPTPNADLFDRRSVLPAGSSPLHFACLRENQDTAQLLVKAGAPLDQPDADGNTPLHDAVEHAAHWSNNTNLTKFLITAGAPLDLTNRDGQTPLRLAVQSGWRGDVELLLKAGARKELGLDNTTLLHIAAAQGSAVAVLPTLLASGLAVDARDSQGRTPFQRAVTNLNLAAMELLLTNGADINAVDLHGDTALHQICLQRVDSIYITQGEEARQALAAKREPPRLHLTGWLLDHGANPNLTNHDGRTPLDLLRTYKWDSPWEKSEAAARIALLLKAGAKGGSSRPQQEDPAPPARSPSLAQVPSLATPSPGANDPAEARDSVYTTNDGTINIARYRGPSGAVTNAQTQELGSVPADVCAKLQALFHQYYPKATFTNREVTGIHFEYEVGTFEVPADTKSGNPATPSGTQQRTERGPKKGGIMCDVLLQEGKYLGQLELRDEGGGYGKFVIDRKVYKEHLMAPYSAKRDADLWVRLLCPSDTSEDFLKGFDAIMKDFQKDVN